MKIQSINPPPAPNFGKLIIKPGSFEALKQSKYFPDKSYPDYNKHLLNFYRRLLDLKKEAMNNSTYNVVIKPENEKGKGRVVIENHEGREQSGFITSFDDLLRVRSMEPRMLLTSEQEPSPYKRIYHNWQIKRLNKKLAHKQLKMDEYLNVVYNNIKDIVTNADCLADMQKLKQK